MTIARTRSGVLIGLALVGAATAAGADIYKTVAADGSVRYTDIPPSAGAQPMAVAPAPVISVQQRRRDAAQQAALQNVARRRLANEAAATAGGKASEGERCRTAREASAYFQTDAVTRRLEKDDPRRFYTAAEISQRRAVAKATLARDCPG
jgi:hypothetical protein